MAEVLVAGTLDGEASVQRLSNLYPEQSFTRDADDVEDVDGVLVGYGGDLAESVSQRVEDAYKENVPVVTFNDSGGDVEPSLERHSRYAHSDLDQAAPCILMYAGVSAEEVISKG